jgi:hypothetical protein
MQQIQPSKIMLQLHSILSFPQAAARVQANDISQLSNKTLCMQSSINCPPQKKNNINWNFLHTLKETT